MTYTFDDALFDSNTMRNGSCSLTLYDGVLILKRIIEKVVFEESSCKKYDRSVH